MINVYEKFEKHDELNPKLFDSNNKMLPEVREKLLQIADKFVETLKEDEIAIELIDIKLVGSNCSYNYTDKSDIDLHLVADTESLECPDDLYPLLYSAYRAIFNQKYNFSINDIPVEIFVETSDTKQLESLQVKEARMNTSLRSNGVYSVLSDEWIKEPVAGDIPELNETEFEELYQNWENKYFELIEKATVDTIEDFIEDIYELRKKSLEDEGEYGYGNQVFKEFRNLGYLDALKDLKNTLISDELSL